MLYFDLLILPVKHRLIPINGLASSQKSERNKPSVLYTQPLMLLGVCVLHLLFDLSRVLSLVIKVFQLGRRDKKGALGKMNVDAEAASVLW